MEYERILGMVDHTLLKQEATWEEIKTLCDEAMEYKTASVCIPPSFVARAKEYMGDRMAVCTVIGFPNGYQTTGVKVCETADAVKNGADEIDMVIDLGMVKMRQYDLIRRQIDEVKTACGGKLLKVIVETCLLIEEEKRELCRVVSESGADYIKTSTGFSTAGATFGDIALFKAQVDRRLKIKAAGGISSFEDAAEFIRLGADRLGTSRLVKLMQERKRNA